MCFLVPWKQGIFQAASTCYHAGILDVCGTLAVCEALANHWLLADDVQKRFSIFYLIGCVASALAGILAYGLMQLDGTHGLTGWRWIFILEGVVRTRLIGDIEHSGCLERNC